MGCTNHETVHEVTSGWKQSTLIEYSDIFFTKPESDWFLFIKPQVIAAEVLLINCFIEKTNLKYFAECNNEWKKKRQGGNFLYLWIKNEYLQHAIETLDLKIEVI